MTLVNNGRLQPFSMKKYLLDLTLKWDWWQLQRFTRLLEGI